MFLVWWILAQKIFQLCGIISHDHPWEEDMPDLYFYRDSEETEKEKQVDAEKTVIKYKSTASTLKFTDTQPEMPN